MKATLSKYKSSIIESGKRIITSLQWGAKTTKEVMPFGIDSVPLENQSALFLETSNVSEPVIIGYINTKQEALQGETRIYSVDPSNGDVKSFIWLKTDGTIEFNGDTYTSVRYEPLNTSLQNTKTLINVELTKIQTAISSLQGTYAKEDITIDISTAQNDKNKMN